MKKLLLFVITALLLIVSCNDSTDQYNATSEGLEYKFRVESKSQKLPKNGEKLLLKIKYYNQKDSLLFDSREISSRFIMDFIQPKQKGATVDDAYAMMHEGDSISFKIDAFAFYSAADKNSPMLKNLTKGEKLRFEIKLEKILSDENFKKETEQAIANLCSEEQIQLKDYISTKYPNIKPTKSGMYYIEKEIGKGKSISKTDTVAIHYTASFINGEIIYSTFKHHDPLIFAVSDSLVWPCLAETVTYMRKGGKAICISPSDLAAGKYGDKKIPPCKTIIFEIELVTLH